MTDSPVIAIIDDEKLIRNALAAAFSDEGYMVRTFSRADKAAEDLWKAPPDLIILDILMPGLDGLEFCRNWRSKGFETPVIFVSSVDSEDTKIDALLGGGDDYMTKPFSMKELLTRVRVCLRRALMLSAESTTSPVASGIGSDPQLELDPDTWKAYLDGTEIRFTVSEFRMLMLLKSSPGRVFTREQLLEAAYPDDPYISDRNADAHIRRIRKKTASVLPGFSRIETIYGLGYRYSA